MSPKDTTRMLIRMNSYVAYLLELGSFQMERTNNTVAPFYYAENIKSGCELGSSKYYSKRVWSNLDHQNRVDSNKS